jgi:hypothetical protein
MFTGRPGKGPKAGILNSIAFHKIQTGEFDFEAISRVGDAIFSLYTSTLFLVRVSQKKIFVALP